MIHGIRSVKMAQLFDCAVLSFLIICLLKCNFMLCDVTNDECIKENSCRCHFKSNDSVIDLHTIGSKNSARFVQTIGNYTYYYNPCYDFEHRGGGPCEKGVAACVQNGTEFLSVGNQASSAFNYNQSTGIVSINYTAPDGKNNLTVRLSCYNGDNSLDFSDDDNSHHYVWTLKTKCACPNKCVGSEHKGSGLSTGSVLIILLVVVLFVYFVGGMVFLRFYRGADGIEIIPHYEFWTDLPVLIRDGILFTLNGCKPDASYDRI